MLLHIILVDVCSCYSIQFHSTLITKALMKVYRVGMLSCKVSTNLKTFCSLLSITRAQHFVLLAWPLKDVISEMQVTDARRL